MTFFRLGQSKDNFNCGSNQNICCAKDEGVVDPNSVTRQLKKFYSGCKTLEHKARPGRPKSMDSKAVLQAIETISFGEY